MINDRNLLSTQEFSGIVTTTCDSFSFLTFPYDTVDCSIDIAATSVKVEVDLDFKGYFIEKSAKANNNFIDVSEVWQVDGLSNSTSHTFLNELSNDDLSITKLRFGIHLSRKSSLHYIAIILIPVACLNFIQSFSFFLPPEMDRATFTITTVLAYYVVLDTSYSFIPQTSETIYLIIYLVGKLVWSTLIVIYMLILAMFASRFSSKYKRHGGKMITLRKIDAISATIALISGIVGDVLLYSYIFRK